MLTFGLKKDPIRKGLQLHFRRGQSDFFVLIFFAKRFPHLMHRGTVCAVPRFFPLGQLVPKFSGFGEAPQQAFLQPAGMQK